MKAVTVGTISYREVNSVGDLTANEVVFVGDYVFAADHLTALMVWDAGLGNVRAMTAQEIAALPAQQQAARDAAKPDLASARDAAQAALDNNATYLAIASPTQAQAAAQVKALTQQSNQIIRALKLLAIAALS